MANADVLAAYLARYDRLVEVGVGRRPDIAAALTARGKTVTATDVHERSVPDGVRFIRDDVMAQADRVAAGDSPGATYDADAVYARNLPPELHRPTRDVARAAGADFLFTTLGGDGPTIPVRRETVGPETVYVVADDGRAPRDGTPEYQPTDS